MRNVPVTFQNFINDILHRFQDLFVIAYLDDILIFSESLKEHKRHGCQVLVALQDNELYLTAEKCEFHQTSVKYLGFIISTEGAPDLAKISTAVNCGKEENKKENREKSKKKEFKDLTSVQRLLGSPNCYQRFIQNYSGIVAPLTKLSGKDVPFRWMPECQTAIDTLKTAFTTTPILRQFDHNCEIIVKTDASDYVSAGMLSQYDDEGILHPVDFFSRKHSPAECNYEIYDKELMAIVMCFEE